MSARIVPFLLVPLLTFHLTAGEYGVTDMATTVISLVTPLATLSVADAVLRFVIEDRGGQRRYVAVGAAVTAASCVLVAACTPLLDLPVFGGLGDYKVLFTAAYASGAFQLYYGNVARALDLIRLIPVASLLAACATGGGAYVFVAVFDWGVRGFLYATIAGNAIGALTYVLVGRLWRYHAPASALRGDGGRLFAAMMAYALPMVPNALFWWVGTSINRFFITGMIGIAASGMFAAIGKVPNLITVVYQIFQQAWNLSAFQEFRRDDSDRFFGTMFRIVSAGMTMAASALVLLVRPLSALMLQKGFYQGWPLVSVMVLAVYFNVLNSFYGTVFTASMRTRSLLTTTCAGSLACVALTWLLIPPMGLLGACMAMVVSNALVLALRMVRAESIVRMQVDRPAFAASLGLLTLQVAVTAAGTAWSGVASAACVMALAVVQFRTLRPMAAAMMRRRGRG